MLDAIAFALDVPFAEAVQWGEGRWLGEDDRPMPAYDSRPLGRMVKKRGWTHAKMEANTPPQSLPAGHGYGVVEDSRACHGGHSDRIQRRAGLPFRPHSSGILLEPVDD